MNKNFRDIIKLKFKINYKYDKILSYNFNFFNFIIKKGNIISIV